MGATLGETPATPDLTPPADALYRRDADAGWTADVQRFDALQGASNGWTAEYDPAWDAFWVTTPEGQGVYYYRVR